MKPTRDPRIDAYIAAAAPFAQPILRHLRELVHRACPEVVETMKWSMPHFEHHGILCNTAAFKAHCSFGFWHQEVGARCEHLLGKAGLAMGQFGRITSLADLPPDKVIVDLIREAAALNEAGRPARPRSAAKPRAALAVPADLAAALKIDAGAATAFAGLSPSHRREYIEWITEAKRPETRQKRLASTLVTLAAGQPWSGRYHAAR